MAFATHTRSQPTTNNKRICSWCGTIENIFNWRLNYEFTNKSAIQFYLLIKENCITIIMYFKYLYIALMLVFQLLWLFPVLVLVMMLFHSCLSSFAALHLLFRLILTSFESITMYRFLSKLSPAAHALSFRFYILSRCFHHRERTDTRYLLLMYFNCNFA